MRTKVNLSDPKEANERFLHRIQTHLTPERLHLILMPTEQCNFRCTYCYERFDLGQMPDSVVNGIKRLVENRAPTLRALSISWFGGEPLVASEIVCDLSRFFCQTVAQHPNLHYAASMTTNGYFLNPYLCEDLYRLGVKEYQITLDGPAKLHDETRHLKGGQGTLAQIWRNLLGIKQSGLDINVLLRLHFQRSTYKLLQDFVATLNKEFGDDERFSIMLKGVERLGGKNDEEIELMSREDKSAIEQTIMREAGRLVRTDNLVYSAPVKEQVCYACSGNSFVIRSNGRINKCTVALYSDSNDIGYIAENGDLHIENEKFSAWVAPLFSNDPNALKCPYVYAIQ